MRMKQFIILIVIFTILYIVFFIVFDKLMAKKDKNDARKKAMSLMSIEQYSKFASFYGIQATASMDIIMKIYDAFMINHNCIISNEAKLYGVSNIEFVIIILYLEYLGLTNKKMISMEMDSIKQTTFVEQNIIQKYNTYFQEKHDFDTIIHNMGKNAVNDLSMMNRYYLMPGVRLIDSKLYYVGDYL